jgi:hypothetical protein
MLRDDTLQSFVKLVRMTTEAKTIDQYTTIVRDQNGGVVRVDADPKPRTTIAYSIADLVRNCQDICLPAPDGVIAGEILYSRRGIRGFYTSDRRESISMRFTPSPAFRQLVQWDQKPDHIKQDAFVLLLKSTFRHCCDDTLEKIIRTIKWTMGNSGSSTVRQGNISIDKSIIAEMTGTDDLNKIEYVVFNVPIFLELPTIRAQIECHLRPIPDQQMFSIIPTGGEIENAYRTAEDAMRTAITTALGDGSPIKVYHSYADVDNTFAPVLG